MSDLAILETQGRQILVDRDAPEWVFTVRWTINGAGYAKRAGGEFLHRLLLWDELKPGLVVDHINGHRLDNRRANLRVTTQQENMLFGQVKMRSDNTSGVKGVTYHKKNRKWQAQLLMSRKMIYLGSYDTVEEAANARRLFLESLQVFK